MLALARGEGQSIIIDGTIEVKIVKWSRSSVRLAIQAPRQVAVDRDEIWRKMHPGQPTPLEVAEKERNERFAREGPPPPRPPHAPHAPQTHTPQTPEAAETMIHAPVAGIFQAAPGPGGSPDIVVGSAVEAGTLVGTIKAEGGAVTELHAGVKGIVARVLAADGQVVAAGDAVIAVQVSG